MLRYIPYSGTVTSMNADTTGPEPAGTTSKAGLPTLDEHKRGECSHRPAFRAWYDAGYQAGADAERQRIRQALAIRLREVMKESAYADLLDGADG